MKFKLSKEEIKNLYVAKGPEGCFASNRIKVDGMPVGYMYREDPDLDSDFPDSGWRFFAGDEDEEYSDEPDNFNLFSLNTICNYDSGIIPYLNAPFGSAFIRDGQRFVEDI